jgi:hypothetical protein
LGAKKPHNRKKRRSEKKEKSEKFQKKNKQKTLQVFLVQYATHTEYEPLPPTPTYMGIVLF